MSVEKTLEQMTLELVVATMQSGANIEAKGISYYARKALEIKTEAKKLKPHIPKESDDSQES